MPTTYAHYLFGENVYQRLSPELQALIHKHRKLYDFGVHGPDILFYHNPLKDKLYEYGNDLHEYSGKDFFTRQKDYWQHCSDPEALLAYLLGFACHFLLDSACHSYIEKKDRNSSASHARIEAEFDRYLLEKEGRIPAYQQDVTTHLFPSQAIATLIAPCFPFSEKEICQTLKRMKKLLTLLQCPHDTKRQLFMKLSDWFHLSSFTDLILLQEEDPVCRDSNLRLEKLYNRALAQAPSSLEALVAYYQEGQALPKEYEDNFSYHPGWEDIPLYSYEEESHYEI